MSSTIYTTSCSSLRIPKIHRQIIARHAHIDNTYFGNLSVNNFPNQKDVLSCVKCFCTKAFFVLSCSAGCSAFALEHTSSNSPAACHTVSKISGGSSENPSSILFFISLFFIASHQIPSAVFGSLCDILITPSLMADPRALQFLCALARLCHA